MDRRELLTGLGAALAGAGCAAGPRARDPLPDPVEANYVAELERDLARIKATTPSPELAATLQAEGFAPRAFGQWLSSLALVMAYRSNTAALQGQPAFLELVLRQSGEVAESLLTVGAWLERLSPARRRQLSDAAGPDETLRVIDRHFLRRGSASTDRLQKLGDGFGRTHRRLRRQGADPFVTGLLGRFKVELDGGAADRRVWSATGDVAGEESGSGGGLTTYHKLYLAGGLGLVGGGVGLGVGFCIGCGANSGSYNIGCYVGITLLLVGAGLMAAGIVTNIASAVTN